jgi:hypothetical protein
MHQFKALGVIAVATLTLAVGVSTASATTAKFGSNAYPVVLA